MPHRPFSTTFIHVISGLNLCVEIHTYFHQNHCHPFPKHNHTIVWKQNLPCFNMVTSIFRLISITHKVCCSDDQSRVNTLFKNRWQNTCRELADSSVKQITCLTFQLSNIKLYICSTHRKSRLITETKTNQHQTDNQSR